MKKLSKAILLSLVAVLLISMPVLAAVAYRASYTIVESGGTAYDMLAVSELVNNQWLADNGFMESDALDTRIETLGGAVKPHMVATNKTLTAVAVPASSQTNLYFTTANSDLAMNVITGYSGYITTLDSENLELGDSFEVEVSGYIFTTLDDYVDRNLVWKEDAFKLYISAEGSIKAEITGGNSVTATGIDSGDMIVKIKADGINLEIYVDDMVTPEDTALIGAAVPDEVTDWIMLQNNVMPYIEYIKIRVGG